MNNQLIFMVVGIWVLAITALSSQDDTFFVSNNTMQSCECYNDNCGCCEAINLNKIGVNGIVCTNFSYLPESYGVSVTLTWNNYTLFNETISAKNPPPICFGIPDLEKIKAHICLRLYDLNFENKHFHGCGRISVSVYHIVHKSIDLGCFNIPKESLRESYVSGSRWFIQEVRGLLETLEFWTRDSPKVTMI